MPGMTIDKSEKYRFLAWNQVGSVATKYDDSNFSIIQIEFADKQFHKNLLIGNQLNAQLGALNYCGALFASQGRKTNIDEYEDETRKSKYVSTIKFHPF